MNMTLKNILRPIVERFIYLYEFFSGFKTDPTGFVPSRLEQLTKQYEPETIACLKSLIIPEDVIFDIGANVGYVSKSSLKAVGKGGQVEAFEPNPRIFAILSSNLRKHKNINLHNCALGSKKGTLALTICADGNVSSFIEGYTLSHVKGSRFEESIESTEVPLETGDFFASKYEQIKLIKIDVEGFELEVLKGFSESLSARKIKNILFEYNSRAQNMAGLFSGELLHFLLEFKFELFLLKHSTLIKITSISDIVEADRADTFFNVLAKLKPIDL